MADNERSTAFNMVKEADEEKTQAHKAVLIARADQLDSEHQLDHEKVLFHGPKERNIRVDVGNDSTTQGKLLPAPWRADGNISELYLLRGGKYDSKKSEHDLNKSESETAKFLKDTAELGTYVQNLTETNKELKRLHVSHIPAESRSINFDSILQAMSSDESCKETVVKKVACKALINAPATGYDIIGDIDVVMTKMKSEAAPGVYQRRVYFFHVRYNLQSNIKFGNNDLSSLFW